MEFREFIGMYRIEYAGGKTEYLTPCAYEKASAANPAVRVNSTVALKGLLDVRIPCVKRREYKDGAELRREVNDFLASLNKRYIVFSEVGGWDVFPAQYKGKRKAFLSLVGTEQTEGAK
jgi:hypothetical protein